MFDPTDRPRLFALPPGADFPAALVAGLLARMNGQTPDAMARVQILLNTKRMARRVRTIFDNGPALLLPRLQLVTDLGESIDLAHIPPAVSPLRRRLEVSQLVSTLLDREKTLAPRASLYDLSDSLAALMDEMHGEGVDPAAILSLTVDDASGHWARSLEFLKVVQPYFDATDDEPDLETRQRRVIEAQIERWQTSPPDHPVIVAGSTGSRGSTMLLMKAVAKLPQGAIILPGFDFEMPKSGWLDLADPLTAEDHPQYRFQKLMDEIGATRDDIVNWHAPAIPNTARNALVSLALRPAPVTDSWLKEGPNLPNLSDASNDITLLEAPTQRAEALAIAMRLREAAQTGETAALITPDRMLTRQVSAALSRWNIIPDDSAGEPLQLSAPGRFLRHVAALFHQKLTAEALLTLLKHPLTHQDEHRGAHLRLTRELELYIRKNGMPFPNADALRAWASTRDDYNEWLDWIIPHFIDRLLPAPAPLPDLVEHHIALATAIARGRADDGSGTLWGGDAGKEATRIIDDLRENAPHGGVMSAHDYADLFGAVLSRGEVRDANTPHGNILIWGTLEARVQGADLVILGGLNEGSWPERPSPDPWLNRKMRLDAGLLLPERRIGLSAHDFQQAIGAKNVWLTRSIRSDDAQTVPSRWLNRITNLMDGLPMRDGPAALLAMQARGNHWLGLVAALEDPGVVAPAPRPSPRPPLAARPRDLSVTKIKTLIRDPYSIYVEKVLRLRALDPLMQLPDARLRGILFHETLEAFIKLTQTNPETLTAQNLIGTAETVLSENVDWPEARALWRARVTKIASAFVEAEKTRQAIATPSAFEQRARYEFPDLDFALTAIVDRVDLDANGNRHIYDYKTGKPPAKKQQLHFDLQLFLLAALAERTGFGDLAPGRVESATFVGLDPETTTVQAPFDEASIDEMWARFQTLIRKYFDPAQGYTARRALLLTKDIGFHDHLARYGEWDTTDAPIPEDLQ